MEKKVFRFLFILLVGFVTIFAGDVYAQKVDGPIKNWGTDKAVRLCKYREQTGDGKETVEIVYNVVNDYYGIYYKNDGKWYIVSRGPYASAFNAKGFVTYGDVNGTGGNEYTMVGYVEEGKRMPSKAFDKIVSEDGFTCPDDVYWKPSISTPYVYFTSQTVAVELAKDTSFKHKTLWKTDNEEYKNKFALVNDYLNSISDEEFKKVLEEAILFVDKDQIDGNWGATLTEGLATSISTKAPKSAVVMALEKRVKDKYFLGKKQPNGHLPKGISNVIKKWVEEKYESNQELFKNAIDETISAGNEDGRVSDDTLNYYNTNRDEIFANDQLKIAEQTINQDTSYGSAIQDPTEDITCTSILTQDLTVLVKNAINFIRFLGPLMVIVLTIIDLVSSVFSADISVRKPLGKLVRRLIAAALLFFLPFIIFPLFDFLHITMAEECFEILN